MRYVPELDGLRAVAIIAVLLLHGSYGHIPGGFLGVDLFFALSGYLITRILLAEIDSTGNVNLWDFYRRRIARLYPALLACVLLTAVLWPLDTAEWKADWSFGTTSAAALFYYADFAMPHLGPLMHTWSLSIEEQFYLLWPACCLLLWWNSPKAAFGIAIGVAILRAILSYHEPTTALYHQFYTRVDTILLGASVARIEPRKVYTRQAMVLLAGFAVLVFTTHADDLWLYRGGFTAIGLGSTALVVMAASGACRWLGSAPLVWIGKRSYGLYLYHLPIFGALEVLRVPHSTANFVGVTSLRFALTFAVAAVSYHFLEKPIRDWAHVTQRIAVANQ